MRQVEHLLKEAMGLHAATIGSPMIERAMRARMQSHGLTRQGEYFQLLRSSAAELSALIDAVVVTETWFFRDQQPFAILAKLAAGEWLEKHPGETLRLLSLPCSSGEEPYSMAMALLDAGFPRQRFQIDAVDISLAALGSARRAVYGKNSFRGRDLQFRDRHFQPAKGGHALNANVRETVRFQLGNLLAAETPWGVYDFVFCRNLLIYFDSPTQVKALRKLAGLLGSDGVLFLGSAELPLALANGFASAGLPYSFACRHAAAISRPVELQKPRWHQAAGRKMTPQLPHARPPGIPVKDAPVSRIAVPASREIFGTDLKKARELAEAGRFTDAIRICETSLRENGVSAQAYFLLGLALDGSGSELKAGEMYRKALYLEPRHYETLMQLAQLSEKSGRSSHARILYERAERARKRR
jgi:chemotaxis protein methyltransferase WspC